MFTAFGRKSHTQHFKNFHASFNDITTTFPLKVTAVLQQESDSSFNRDPNHRSRAPPLHAVVDRSVVQVRARWSSLFSIHESL